MIDDVAKAVSTLWERWEAYRTLRTEQDSLRHLLSLEIRRNLAEIGGHATLIRAEAPARAAIDVFQPLDKPVMALTASLKRAFDPVGILNPGRMYPGI